MLKIAYTLTREFKMTDNKVVKFSFESAFSHDSFAIKANNKKAN